MWFYGILFILVVGLTIFSKNKNANKYSMFFLWAVYAFRNQIAVDDEGYFLAFQRLNQGWDYHIEFTFKLFTKLANSLGMNYKLVFLLYATIAFLFLYFAIEMICENNYQKGLFLATFLGYAFIATISVMRQFTAASICFYALIYLYKAKKYMKTIILCVIATLFHGGAIVVFPLVLTFQKKWKVTYNQKILFMLCCLILGYTNVVTKLLNAVMGLLPMTYRVYSNSITGRFSSAGGSVSLIFLLMFLAQCFICSIKNISEPKNEFVSILEKGQLFYLGLLFLFVNAGVASRLAFTFIPFVATIPYTFLLRIDKRCRIILSIVFIIAMFVLYLLTIRATSDIGTIKLIPYAGSFNFWSK